MTETRIESLTLDPFDLRAAVHAPAAGAPRAGVVIAHPHPLMGGDMENALVQAVADACAARGLLALRFDFRHARARGPVAWDALFADSEADLKAASDALRARLPAGAAVGVIGYSFGGLVALRAWRTVQPAALVAVGLPVKGSLRDALPVAALADPARPPLLVLQGQYDDVGAPEDVRRVLAEAGVDATVETVPNASHGYFGEGEIVGMAASHFVSAKGTP